MPTLKLLSQPDSLLLALPISAYFKYFKKPVAVLLLTPLLLTPQILLAKSDLQVIAVKKGQDKLVVYTEPSSAKKSGVLAVDKITGLSQGQSLDVLEEAMSSRFLKVKINGSIHWIKAKQVITTQNYDLGSCEKQNDAVSGNRAAVNCTNR